MLPQPPAAVRNNNPGNLMDQGIDWDGLMGCDERGRCIFATAAKGFRALALDLHTKWSEDGLKTISAILTKFAPPVTNDTAAYIRCVCDMTGIAADAPLNLDAGSQLGPLVRAIAVHEAGGWFFSITDLSLGVHDALHPADAR